MAPLQKRVKSVVMTAQDMVRISDNAQALYLTLAQGKQSVAVLRARPKPHIPNISAAIDQLKQVGLIGHHDYNDGQGGTVWRLNKSEMAPASRRVADEIDQCAPYMKSDGYTPEELSLYEPMVKAIQSSWAKTDGQFIAGDGIYVKDTHKSGHLEGKRQHPDITMLGYHNSPVAAGVPEQELIVFEVKPSSQIDAVGHVDELLGEMKIASAPRGYLVYWIPEHIHVEGLADVFTEAQSKGVGVIIARDPANARTWKTKPASFVRDYNPMIREAFIRSALGDVIGQIGNAPIEHNNFGSEAHVPKHLAPDSPSVTPTEPTLVDTREKEIAHPILNALFHWLAKKAE